MHQTSKKEGGVLKQVSVRGWITCDQPKNKTHTPRPEAAAICFACQTRSATLAPGGRASLTSGLVAVFRPCSRRPSAVMELSRSLWRCN